MGTQPHGVPKIEERLEAGSHIALSFMRGNGYSAECERTFFVREPTSEMRDMFHIMQEARKRAFALIKPGVPCEEIDHAANGFLREQGLGEFLLHRTGHGIGMGNHEGPWVAEGSQDTLAPNMIISIEPGIYVPDLGGFRHSDTVLVTENGYELLTQYPDSLEELTIRSWKPITRLRGFLVRKALGV
ncbi:MAG TPA: M24 family metallopeptidase [Anaerolineae bacterium]|nr:M24 family metallopeptidase [Anaerolineae bacterium]